MDTQQQKELYQSALNKWGIAAQALKAIEEMAELTVNLSKRLNRLEVSDAELIDEVADVIIMSEQMALVIGQKEVEIRKQEKLRRLQTLLD